MSVRQEKNKLARLLDLFHRIYVVKQVSRADNRYYEKTKETLSLSNSFNSWHNLDYCRNNSFFGDWISSLGKRRIADGNCWSP